MAHNTGKPIKLFTTVQDWETWLEGNADHDGIRLQLVKKNSFAPGIGYDEALEVALCFGWIDGQAGTHDDDYFLRAFTPRRPRSMWSQRNRDLVARLIEAGRMRPAGFAEIERAQADGRWEAAYRQKDSVVPDDLKAALDASPLAADLFSRLSSQNRFAILFRISGVKRPATRAANIAKFVAMLERGESIYPQKPQVGPQSGGTTLAEPTSGRASPEATLGSEKRSSFLGETNGIFGTARRSGP